MNSSPFLTDGELADLMRVKPCTISRLAKNGPKRRGEGVIDIRLAEPIVIGSCRRWPRDKVFRILGIGD